MHVDTLRTIFAYNLKTSINDIIVHWPMSRARDMIRSIQKNPHSVHLIIGFDRPLEEEHCDVDQWAQQQSEDYRLFIINDDFLHLTQDTLSLKKIVPLHFSYIVMSNLFMARQHRYAIEQEFYNDTYNAKWLCLNRVLRPHRQYTKYQWLDQLSDSIEYSFGDEKPIGNLDFVEPEVHPSACNALNLLSLSQTYNRTCGAIVTETGPFPSLTEKIFHPLLALHPMLVIGQQNVVAYLRDQGFDMFDDILDHSYDSIPFDRVNERIDQLFSDNMEVITSGIDRGKIMDRLKSNQQHVWQYYDNCIAQLATKLRSYV